MCIRQLTRLFAVGAVCLALHPGAAHAQTLEKAWELAEGFGAPESVVYDAERDVLYVSNLTGGGTEKDGTGYIAKVSPEGELIAKEWAGGLNSPKGLALFGDKLYAADIDELVEIDVNTGEVVARYPAEGAKFLNDVTVDAEGRVYVSDMNTGIVHRLADGMLHSWLVDERLTSPNGVYAEDDRLMLAASDAGVEDAGSKRYLLTVSYDGEDIEPVKDRTPIGALDAIEPDEKGGYFLSDWGGGVVLHFTPADGARVVQTEGRGTADLDYVPETDMLYLPVMMSDKLIAYRVSWE